MSDQHIEHAESLLWEAVRALCVPGRRSQAEAAAAAVNALAIYRAAVEAQAIRAHPGSEPDPGHVWKEPRDTVSGHGIHAFAR